MPSPIHVLVHQASDASGADEWLCADCGRHFIVRFTPEFDQFVLVPGDETVGHTGSRYGLVHATPPRVVPTAHGDPPRGDRH